MASMKNTQRYAYPFNIKSNKIIYTNKRDETFYGAI
jgi:hypothetical protein